MTLPYDLRNDTVAYKARIMANFEALQNGSSLVYTTAQRLALTPTIGTIVYDSSMTSLFQWNAYSWVQIG